MGSNLAKSFDGLRYVKRVFMKLTSCVAKFVGVIFLILMDYVVPLIFGLGELTFCADALCPAVGLHTPGILVSLRLIFTQ